MDISVDITAHILVPKHSKMSMEEANALLEKLNISINQLPKILKSDPAIHNLNAEVGDIILIERNSPTSGKANYYRAVING
ncbi:MAG: DNA-directed RNA polymerase subunit H [archaeon GW2011_AR17]|nr:MAG: DNA-directed RNA polymerase subunit H [archaeon GW2011_AR17]MBS3153783.1 DNA-directed RNA polymerase subunit H [Candidatus Woesearchaeota archaeon]HIH15191.1 DNA-directed RNA polymerase subunit H [Nanoarchaeota archaeon]HIH59457.1 DNA-directed RNA polymerase subunit H [Nanoarchaeota archaeon]HII13855.1 DNA-directed RNA polymerase subunit H [Nanoarchaeota archaeon]